MEFGIVNELGEVQSAIFVSHSEMSEFFTTTGKNLGELHDLPVEEAQDIHLPVGSRIGELIQEALGLKPIGVDGHRFFAWDS